LSWNAQKIVWKNDWLNPAQLIGYVYNLLVEKGELEEYLTGYQLAYSNRAEKIAEKLAAERGEKKFMTHWKRKFSSNKKFGHSQRNKTNFFMSKS